MKRVKDFINGICPLEVTGTTDLEIRDLVYDSREAGKGSMFFALKGLHTDGHDYIDKAVASGASAVVYSDSPDVFLDGVCYVKVENTRLAMSPLSASFYDYPSEHMTVIGVTGTDGKSSTVSFIHQLLEAEGQEAGLLSTVSIKTGNKLIDNPFRQSTPEAPHIHRLLREMVDNGKKFAVIEATSHGLSLRTSRLADVDFDVAVLTNVTHEHLEFHGSLEQYRLDKSNLFRWVAGKSESESVFSVINFDDDWADYFMDAAGTSPVFTYSLKNENADLFASNWSCDQSGTDFTLHELGIKKTVRINMPGLFNVENIMASLLVVSELLDCDIMDLTEHIPHIHGVTGRMTRISGNQPFTVLVDYAHTPGAFKKLFPSIRQNLKGRVISVFGSAGERDIEKRSEQGEIADEYSDIIILTDEDPRGEKSDDIIKEIAEGIKHKIDGSTLFLIPDRKEAIRKAFELARKNDVVLTLGKSHEKTIIYSDGPRPWNEIETVKELLKEIY